MKTIITEEMRFRHRVVEHAIKNNNNAMAARRYDTSRQQVQRWRKKYNGTIQSLANKSRRPHRHPNQHTEEEKELLCKKNLQKIERSYIMKKRLMEMPRVIRNEKAQCAACVYPFTGAANVSMVQMPCGATVAGVAM